MDRQAYVRRQWRVTRWIALATVVIGFLITLSLVFDTSSEDKIAPVLFFFAFVAFAAAFLWFASKVRDAILRKLENRQRL